jgi:hypothetical protein
MKIIAKIQISIRRLKWRRKLKSIPRWIKNQTPVTIRGSYLFHEEPTIILSYQPGELCVKVKGSDDMYEIWRIKRYK